MNDSLLPGARVRARGLAWDIVDVEPAGDHRRLRLRCVDGALRGFEYDLIHPLEDVVPVSMELQPERAARLKDWLLYHQAFLLEQALGPSALLAVQPGRLDIAPYQLVPVMRALAMPRPRLLLADGVGLGKTIQAGLVMAELIARRRAHRILVISPAGPLLSQWHREMRTRFGLRFTPVRSAGELEELRRGQMLGANPFDQVSYCLMSIDFAKQDKVLSELERTAWDLLVIDEAHHCVSMGGAGDWEDSRRRRLAELLARQCDGLLLLTATPHDGYDPHFASLVELLDPSLVDGRGTLRGERYKRHVVRRLKPHIKDADGNPLFQRREVIPRPVRLQADSSAFETFHRAILDLVAPRLRSALRQKRYGEVLAFVSLLKRSVSTARACRNTLAVVRDRYADLVASGTEDREGRRQRLRTLRDYRRRLERYGALSHEEEQDLAALEAEDMAAELFDVGDEAILAEIDTLQRAQRRARTQLKHLTGTRDALDALIALADAAISEDPKLAAVLDEVRTIRASEPGVNVLVYTEYTDSQAELVAHLEGAVRQGALDGKIVSISGPDDEATRTRITERFASEDGLVLVSTDATAEGLNLHERCHHLIHLELPYNPNRLEQRNGRIDRYGQRKTPLVRYLYLAGTFEERLLLRLIAKYERQRARLTFVPDTLGGVSSEDAATASLLAGLAQEQTQPSLFETPSHEVRFDGEAEPEESPESDAYRDLLSEVERAVQGFERSAKTRAWMSGAGLNADERLVREAVEARAKGSDQVVVELLPFARAVIESEARSATVQTDHGDGTFSLAIPRALTFGLDGMPGYDPENRSLRLTADRHQLRGADGDSVGYLGRAHPLVQRAIERVRRARFGDEDALLDRRVSAIASDGPALLYTFLGLVESDAGRELERMLAVRVTATGTPQVFTTPTDWLPLARTGRRIATDGVWEAHFSSWGASAQARATAAAEEAFVALAQPVVVAGRAARLRERDELDRWLRDRATTICGAVVQATFDLFAAQDAAAPSRWQTLDDPAERLAAFATDGANPPTRRREADGVLRLYRQRGRDLQARSAPRVLSPSVLGLLMIAPEET